MKNTCIFFQWKNGAIPKSVFYWNCNYMQKLRGLNSAIMFFPAGCFCLFFFSFFFCSFLTMNKFHIPLIEEQKLLSKSIFQNHSIKTAAVIALLVIVTFSNSTYSTSYTSKRLRERSYLLSFERKLSFHLTFTWPRSSIL